MKDSHSANTEITFQDFVDINLDAILSAVKFRGYHSYGSALFHASQDAEKENLLTRSKILSLLSDICLLIICPDCPNSPYSPVYQSRDKRSFLPEDLLDTEIDFLASIVSSTNNIWIEGRIADVVWLTQKKRDSKYAILAIDAFMRIPIDRENWTHDGRECWSRAIKLTKSLKDRAGQRLQAIEKELIRTFLNLGTENESLGADIVDILDVNKLGKQSAGQIATHLSKIANDFRDTHHHRNARIYYERSSKWYKENNEDTESARVITEIDKSLKTEADFISKSGNYIVAARSIEDAIITLRTIPRSQRNLYKVDQRILDLQSHLLSVQEGIRTNKNILSTHIDVSETQKLSRDAVSNKTPREALMSFCAIHPLANVEQLRKIVMDNLARNPLRLVTPCTTFNKNGKTIAKCPAINLNNGHEKENEKILESMMREEYNYTYQIAVKANIMPALEILLKQHCWHEQDFIRIAHESLIVPPGREVHFGKALFLGMERDFGTAVYLLTPQIENMVRYHLNSIGVRTTTFDDQCIETEVGLGKLMEKPETTEEFGEDLCFEIKALFCSPDGPNLRNSLAHGLVDDEIFDSCVAVYAWWFGLHLVLMNWDEYSENDVQDEQPRDHPEQDK